MVTHAEKVDELYDKLYEADQVYIAARNEYCRALEDMSIRGDELANLLSVSDNCKKIVEVVMLAWQDAKHSYEGDLLTK